VGISKAAGIIFPGSNIAKCALVIGTYVSGLMMTIKANGNAKEAEKNKTIKSSTKIDDMTNASLSLLAKMKETLSKLESNLRSKEKKTVEESFDLYNSDLFGFPTM
jgi:hypothetical protein